MIYLGKNTEEMSFKWSGSIYMCIIILLHSFYSSTTKATTIDII